MYFLCKLLISNKLQMPFHVGDIRVFCVYRGTRYHHTYPFPIFPLKAAIPPHLFYFSMSRIKIFLENYFWNCLI